MRRSGKVMNRFLSAAVIAALLIAVPAAAGASETRVYIRFSVGGSLIIGGGILFWSINAASRAAQKKEEPADSQGLSEARRTGFSAEKVAAGSPPRNENTDETNDILIAFPFLVFHW